RRSALRDDLAGRVALHALLPVAHVDRLAIAVAEIALLAERAVDVLVAAEVRQLARDAATTRVLVGDVRGAVVRALVADLVSVARRVGVAAAAVRTVLALGRATAVDAVVVLLAIADVGRVAAAVAAVALLAARDHAVAAAGRADRLVGAERRQGQLIVRLG